MRVVAGWLRDGLPLCATGQAGLTRNLSTGEIVAQVMQGARALARGELPGGPGRVSNVVFMGMGEPLANYASVLRAVRRITDPVPDGLGISQRSVTVSTVGLVPAIRGSPVRGCRCGSRCPCMPPMTSCGISSSR